MPDFIHIHPQDNVAVALRPIPAGTAFQGIAAAEDIPQGHKMALQPIEPGDQVIKYGFSIGHATAAAAPGCWVHTHNMKTNLSGEVEYTYNPKITHPAPAAPATLRGFRRRDVLWRDALRRMVQIADGFLFQVLIAQRRMG